MDTILCDELLQEIFHRLPPPSSSAVSLVSKRWLRLLRSSLSSLSLRLSPNHHHLSTFLSHHTYLSSLSLSTTTTSTTAAVTSDDLLTSISTAVPNLTRLRISTGPLSSFLPLLSLSNLQSLSIILHRNNLYSSLHFLTYFQSLKNLTVNLTGNTSPVTEFHSPSPEFHQSSLLRLQSLQLSGIRSGDHELTYLWRNCNLETLTKLAFENCDGIGDNCSFSSFINGLKSLQELELKTSRSIVGLILIKLTENVKSSSSLKSLVIYDGGSKDGLLHFLRESRCFGLERIDLRLPLDLTDDHLMEIGAKFYRLRVLRLGSCSMVTGEGFKSLGFGLSENNSLEELSLTNCDSINSLEELSLTNCDLINRHNGILVELAQSLRNVKILDLSYNHTLIDKEFESMISSYRDLKKLKVRGCSRLTNSSLIAICKKCKRLESIDLLYCHGFEIEGVEFMILNSPELRKLQVEDRKVSEISRRWMKNKFIEIQN